MNIYKILESLQRVEESQMDRVAELYSEWLNSEFAPLTSDAGDDHEVIRKAESFLRGQIAPEHIEAYAQQMAHEYHGGLYEADYPFAGKAVGQKAGDQVRGKEAFKTGGKEHPAKGRLVGASESIEVECNDTMSPLEKKLRARWEQTKAGLQEYGPTGMTTGDTAMGGANATANTQPDPQEIAKTQQAVNKLKSAGVNIPNVGQAVKSTLKDPVNEPVSMQDKQVAGGLGQEVEQLLAKGDPSTVNQLAALIRKNKQG